MFFYSKGSLKEVIQDKASLFDAASQFNSDAIQDNESKTSIILASKPLIWKVTDLRPASASSNQLCVFDGDENAWVGLDNCVEYMISNEQDKVYESIRKGSVILVKSYRKHENINKAERVEASISLTKLIVLGYDLNGQPTSDTESNIEQDLYRSEQSNQPPKLTISKLRPSLRNTTWSFLAKLQDKTPIREFVTRSNSFKGRLVRLLFQDHTGFLECVIFNDLIERHGISSLCQNAVYTISDGQVKHSSMAMKAWPEQVSSDVELIFTDTTTIQQVEDKNISNLFVERLPKRKISELENEVDNKKGNPHTSVDQTAIKKLKGPSDLSKVSTQLHNSFETLDQVFFKSKGSFTSCIAVITQVGELKSIKKPGHKKLSLRNITITDKSTQTINVALWGKQAEEFEMARGSIIMLKECQVSNYDGLSLSVLMKTKILELFVSNNISYVSELSDWWNSQ